MRKLTSVLATALVSGGAVLAFSSPASAATTQWPCPDCYDNPRIEQAAQEENSYAPAGIAALGGLTVAGLAGLALRRRRAASDAA